MTLIIDIDGQIEVDSPMRQDHFYIAVSHMRLKDENLIEACRRILVDEERNGKIEKEFDVGQTHLSRTCKNIIRKWKDICAEEGMVSREYVLKPSQIGVVDELEKPNIDTLEKYKNTRKKR